MDDFVLIDGDQVTFLPNFGSATVVVQAGKLKGTGDCTLNGKKVCIEGDEQGVSVPGCSYMTPQYSIPGTGTLTIESLGRDQKAQATDCRSKAMLLKGSQFRATFKVTSPAKQPPPGPGAPIPDATPQYSGSGKFVTTNSVLKTR